MERSTFSWFTLAVAFVAGVGTGAVAHHKVMPRLRPGGELGFGGADPEAELRKQMEGLGGVEGVSAEMQAQAQAEAQARAAQMGTDEQRARAARLLGFAPNTPRQQGTPAQCNCTCRFHGV